MSAALSTFLSSTFNPSNLTVILGTCTCPQPSNSQQPRPVVASLQDLPSGGDFSLICPQRTSHTWNSITLHPSLAHLHPLAPRKRTTKTKMREELKTWMAYALPDMATGDVPHAGGSEGVRNPQDWRNGFRTATARSPGELKPSLAMVRAFLMHWGPELAKRGRVQVPTWLGTTLNLCWRLMVTAGVRAGEEMLSKEMDGTVWCSVQEAVKEDLLAWLAERARQEAEKKMEEGTPSEVPGQ